MLAVLGVGVEPLLTLGLRALARRADVHHQLAVGPLGQRERAGVQRVGELLIVLGDHAGPAARGPVELDQLDIEQRRDLRHGSVELRREPAAHATGPVRDLHACSSDADADSAASVSASLSYPLTYRLSS